METLTVRVPTSSRFRILDQPYSLPSKCAFCGIGHNEDGRRQFVDTGLDLDWYGVVYICTNCFIEIAQTLGFLSPQQYTNVCDAGIEAEIENIGLKVENDALRTALNLLSDHRCFKPVNPAHAAQYKSEHGEPQVPGNPLESGKPESSDTPESDDGKGLSDVRGNAADDSAEHGKSARKRSSSSILDDLV